MFDSLKGELVNDPLIEGQPEFSKTWMQRVSIARTSTDSFLDQAYIPCFSPDPSVTTLL